MSIPRSILLVFLGVTAFGCGGGGGNGSTTAPDARGGGGVPAGDCDTSHCDAIDTIFTCFQWTGLDDYNRDLCTQYGGTIADGACPTANAVGGCKSALDDQGACAINWGYPPITADNVRESCTGTDEMFINP